MAAGFMKPTSQMRQTNTAIAKTLGTQQANIARDLFNKTPGGDAYNWDNAVTQAAQGGGFINNNGKRTIAQLQARKAELVAAKNQRLSNQSYATSIQAPQGPLSGGGGLSGGNTLGDIQAALQGQQDAFQQTTAQLQQQLAAQLQTVQNANTERDNYFKQLMDIQNQQATAASLEQTRASTQQADEQRINGLLMQRALDMQAQRAAQFRYI